MIVAFYAFGEHIDEETEVNKLYHGFLNELIRNLGSSMRNPGLPI